LVVTLIIDTFPKARLTGSHTIKTLTKSVVQ